MEAAYNTHNKKEKAMCKHCKSTAHGSLQHRKHYKNFREEGKEKRMEKHMKAYSESDMGSMKGYDPTGGLGNKGYAKATAVPKATPFKLNGRNSSDGGASNQIPGALTPRVSTQARPTTPNIKYKHKKGIGGGMSGNNLKKK